MNTKSMIRRVTEGSTQVRNCSGHKLTRPANQTSAELLRKHSEVPSCWFLSSDTSEATLCLKWGVHTLAQLPSLAGSGLSSLDTKVCLGLKQTLPLVSVTSPLALKHYFTYKVQVKQHLLHGVTRKSKTINRSLCAQAWHK